MKKYKLIWLVIIVSFGLILGFEISSGKISFGSAWWSDTTSTRITTNKAINLRPGDSLYYNGNVVTSGTGSGGDAYLGNSQTFTGYNYFSQGTYFSDSVRVNRNILIADSVKVLYNISAIDSISSTAFVSNDLYLNGIGGSIRWRGYSSYITEGINVLNYSAKTHSFVTRYGNNIIADIDSTTGMDLKYGNYYKNGTLLFDSTKYAHTDLGTEIFSNVVKFITNIVDFAAGLTTTTITASSTATFNGDVVTSGYVDEGNTGWFGKRYMFKGKIGGAGTGYVNIAHGLDWTRIINYDCVVRNDTTNGGVPVAGQPKFVKPGSYFGALTCYSKIDSLYCQLSVGNGANNNLLNDSVWFTVWYRP